jgi:hypothetical protein
MVQLSTVRLSLGMLLMVAGAASSARAAEGITKGTPVAHNIFAGGKYLVDTSKKGRGTAEIVPDGKPKAERQVTLGLR